MDVNTFDEDISKQDQSKLNINDSDLEDTTDEEEFYLSEEEADNDDVSYCLFCNGLNELWLRLMIHQGICLNRNVM